MGNHHMPDRRIHIERVDRHNWAKDLATDDFSIVINVAARIASMPVAGEPVMLIPSNHIEGIS